MAGSRVRNCRIADLYDSGVMGLRRFRRGRAISVDDGPNFRSLLFLRGASRCIASMARPLMATHAV